jgi:hypothetical protein
MTMIKSKEDKELEVISNIVSSRLTKNMTNKGLERYIKNNIIFYKNQLKKEIKQKKCDDEFNKYKEFDMLNIKEHGVVGIPIKITTNKNKSIFLKINLYSDIKKVDILNDTTTNYFEYMINKLLYDLVKNGITNNVIEPLNYYNCRKEQFLKLLYKLYIEKVSYMNDFISNNNTVDISISDSIEKLENAYKLIKYKFESNSNKSEKMNREYEIVKWIPSSYISLHEFELVNGVSLSHHLRLLIDILNNKTIKVFLNSLFQILYTLITINKVYSKFQHNDLHLNNLLIDYTKNKSSKSNIYELWNNKYELSLKDTGVVKIIDFDKSSINYLENKKIKHYFKNDIYNHLDNNYDSLYVLNGYYKVLFTKYFSLFDTLLIITNCTKIADSILILKGHKKDSINNDNKIILESLNRNDIIILLKCLFFFRDLNNDLTKDDINNFVLFFDGDIDLVNNEEIKTILYKMNIIRKIINKMNNILNYITFFHIYINDKYAHIIMKDYSKNKDNNKSYTTLEYFNKKIDRYNNLLNDKISNKEILIEYVNNIIKNIKDISYDKIEGKVLLLLESVYNIYDNMTHKQIIKTYNAIKNDELFLNNEIMNNAFDIYKSKGTLNKSKINEIYSDKNIKKIN